MAVLHPLRAAALFTRTRPRIDLVELLSLLFHDILEDVKPGQFGVQEWKDMEIQLYGLFDRMAPEDEPRLMENMLSLTRLGNESYYQYIGRLLENARQAPEIIEVKLADRLDNTLDLRIDLEDPLARIDFFENIYQILFVNNYKGYVPKWEHSPATAINGAKRLYQLFKNSVLLSLIRQYAPDAGTQRSQKILFDAVSEAGLNEAQRTLIHLVSYHVKDVSTQRRSHPGSHGVLLQRQKRSGNQTRRESIAGRPVFNLFRSQIKPGAPSAAGHFVSKQEIDAGSHCGFYGYFLQFFE